ncbi:MAG TPA: CARDB domain-containing protein, partial [Armatimonadota bacterium]|nr:CARDB domain-containing protein [Armatimonadota bacterium]
MRLIVLFVLLGLLAAAPLFCADLESAETLLSWFSDAAFDNSARMSSPAAGLPEVPGTAGKGVLLSRPAAIEGVNLSQESGYISFWIKPNWNGNDGKRHVILRVGDMNKNGLLVEKSEKGFLRYVMASPKKVTSSRADVSDWKAGQWHHIAIVWFSKDNKPLGMPLWIDKVAVDGPIASGNQFFDVQKMDDKRLYIGDETSDAAMDELIIRKEAKTELSRDMISVVYRDYFATAPFTAIKIDPDACDVPSDKRVVNGCPKQFGMRAKLDGQMVRITENIAGYGNWSDFDAKPFIKWSTSDEKVATVDKDGIVTGKSVGKCKLTAEFRGMKDAYNIEVISPEQPDLDLYCVSRLPRYSSNGPKWWPAPGERVQAVAHIANFGYRDVPAGAVVRFQLIPDKNGNFRLDKDEKPVETQEQVIEKSMKPREEIKLTFNYTWPNDPVWIKVTVDPDKKIGEICEANNERCELNTARAMRWGYKQCVLDDDYDAKKINMVGSFSYYDWFNAQAHRVTLMLQEAVYPTTSPVGVKDAIRTDAFYALSSDDLSKEPYDLEAHLYDGGFPVADNKSGNQLVISSGLVHEFGHCCIALPDLYGYPVKVDNIFLKDENGEYYAGGELLPDVSHGSVMCSSAQTIPCGGGYTPLMDYCHMWLHPAHAGQVQYFAGYRGEKFWGTQGRLIPSLGHVLQIYDVNDEPLSGAAVYVYHVSQTGAQDAGTKYFADRPKFMCNTDKDGRFIIPRETDSTWDSPDTDDVDGAIGVWNPYGTAKTDTAFTPNVWSVEGLILLKIVS